LSDRRSIAGAAGRGVVAAMAMTGLRRMTTGLGLVRKPPPEEIATEGLSGMLATIPPAKRNEAIELAHWAFGAAASIAYALLPAAMRRLPFAGPMYGLAIWAGYETVGKRILVGSGAEDDGLSAQVAIALDHLLYGAIIGVDRS